MKIKKIDIFYTPPDLAKKLLEYVDDLNVENVVDFCVGKGELLKAAESKFDNIKCYGTDIDESIVNEITISHSHWNIEVCDFTNSQSREETSILHDEFFDLILSNPPFTCRGSKINKVEYLNNIYHVSTAMMFLVESLRYLSLDGSLYAIMPSSVVSSEKDRKLLAVIRCAYDIKVLEEIERQAFKDCAPNIVLIKINHKKTISNNAIDNIGSIYTSISTSIFDARDKEISIFRGNLSVYESPNFRIKGGKNYIHSTNLKNNKIVHSGIKVNKPSSMITGPAILIHRVGKPDISKVCKLSINKTVVLSDCIIAIIAKSQDTINEIYDAIITNEATFIGLYKGTGAKYLTIERIKMAFNLLCNKSNNY